MPSTVVSYADLLSVGITPARVRTMQTAGQWVRPRRGVYAEAGSAELVAALGAVDATVRRRWVASHGTAARLHGLTLLRPPDMTRLILTVDSRSAKHSDLPGLHFQRAALPPGHVTEVDGLPVTTVARTLVDLARRLPVRDGLVAIDAALHGRQVDEQDLLAVLADCRRWPYVRRAAYVVGMGDTACESPLESLSRLFFVDHEIPAPRSQATLTANGLFLGRSDFWWEDRRVVGEADGMGKYSSPEVLYEEKLRQERLERAGITVVRWMWRDIWQPAPARHTARRLYRALALPG